MFLIHYKQVDLGAFYTPKNVAQILTDWAIIDPTYTVLDPSYGGCAFLYAARDSLHQIGSATPERQVFGVDIDPAAKRHLDDMLNAGADASQYLTCDFFDIDLSSFGGPSFGSIVGNPPYVRHHDIPTELRKRAIQRLRQFGITVSGRSSYWALFLLYSARFVREGGRLAMIVPGAALHADYSVGVMEMLSKRFRRISIYALQERIFDGTSEESVILCAEGADQRHEGCSFHYVPTVLALREAIGKESEATLRNEASTKDGGSLRSLLAASCLDAYDRITTDPNIVRLGKVATPRIGVVTGCNDYFIMSEQERKDRRLHRRYFVPVVRKLCPDSALSATDTNIEEFRGGEQRYLLLSIGRNSTKRAGRLSSYLDQGVKQEVHLAQKCRTRDPWYSVPLTKTPGAFAACMSGGGPRIVANLTSYTCTNNIIGLYWNPAAGPADWTRLALGSLSSAARLSAELVGRSYGGGVLKLEPSEIARWAVPLVPEPRVNNLVRKVDRALRQADVQAATALVDEALIEIGLLTKAELCLLQVAAFALLTRRRPQRLVRRNTKELAGP